jgi:hypothetical protein
MLGSQTHWLEVEQYAGVFVARQRRQQVVLLHGDWVGV